MTIERVLMPQSSGRNAFKQMRHSLSGNEQAGTGHCRGAGLLGAIQHAMHTPVGLARMAPSHMAPGLPGDVLRRQLVALSRPRRSRRGRASPQPRRVKRGRGLSLPGGGLSLPGGAVSGQAILKKLATVSAAALPCILKELAKGASQGKGLKLAGQGVGGRLLSDAVFMKMMKDIKVSGSGKIVMAGSGKKSKAFFAFIKKASISAAKVLLPILLELAKKKILERSGAGKGRQSRLKSHLANPAVRRDLGKHLTQGLMRLFMRKLVKGKGMDGGSFASFWRGFKKGFMKVMTPALKVAKAVAPIIPLVL